MCTLYNQLSTLIAKDLVSMLLVVNTHSPVMATSWDNTAYCVKVSHRNIYSKLSGSLYVSILLSLVSYPSLSRTSVLFDYLFVCARPLFFPPPFLLHQNPWYLLSWESMIECLCHVFAPSRGIVYILLYICNATVWSLRYDSLLKY